MFGRTGEADPAMRVFTRAEIAGILGVSADQPSAARWPAGLRDRYLAAASSLELGQFAGALIGTHAPAMPRIRVAGATTSEGRPVTDLLQETRPSVLAGRTGMGKSTAAELLRRDGARHGQAVLVAHAEAYLPGRLSALAADAISELIREDLPAASGRQALADKAVTLIIDGVSEVPDDIRLALADELRAPEPPARARGPSCSAETSPPSSQSSRPAAPQLPTNWRNSAAVGSWTWPAGCCGAPGQTTPRTKPGCPRCRRTSAGHTMR